MDKVGEGTISHRALSLERKASRYRIKKSPFFDGDPREFEIHFSQGNGKIAATYDQSGRILKTYERFKNLAFPPKIRNAIYGKYPNWSIHKDSYSVSYDYRQGVKKEYRAQLRKNNAKLNIELDGTGAIRD